MHQDHSVIIVCRAVIRLALTDADKTAVNIIIWDVIILPEVPVIERKFSHANTRYFSYTLMTELLRRCMIVQHRSISDNASVNAAEFEFSVTKHQRCAPPLFRLPPRGREYHRDCFGIRNVTNVPIRPAIVPVINPPKTSDG